MRRTIVALLAPLALLVAGCLGGATDAPPASGEPQPCLVPEAAQPDAAWKPERPHVRVTTTQGDFTIALETERAPVTASNFLNLTRDGFYDGVLFHRVIEGFVIQGGDPLSKDDEPANDGTGGPGYEIPDEFHPKLRHAKAGMLSMANSGPDTGGSQFFVTLGETPHLDDRHSVFGEVVEGLGTVQKIGGLDGDGDERPDVDVRIAQAREVDAVPYDATHRVDVHPVLDQKKTEGGRPVTFAVVLKNEGNVRDAIALAAHAPEGWTCEVNEAPVVPAETARVVFFTATPPEGAAEGTRTLTLEASSAWEGTPSASAEVQVEVGELGRAVESGDSVVANYVGLLPDGRVFDTSVESVANDAEQPKFETIGGYRERPSYTTFDFTVGSGVIAGFTNLALTAKEGETVTARIPSQDAYAQGNVYQRPLTGRDLVFELEIVSVK